ncbi:WD repeat-containing protein WRAP73, putative [Hepatocystis sp. ex Piliocolobus tephrosceles]|nr:WD repeat-containing protein WRAP73, putative [Hepatocystis sp. ex Piliocolobus tephrosceles]
MNLQNVYKCDFSYFSNDGLFLLYIIHNKIYCVDLENFEVVTIYVCSYKIDHIEFSNDNKHFLVLMKKHGCVCIYSLYENILINKIEDYFQTYVYSSFINKDNGILVHKYEKKSICIYDFKESEQCVINIPNVKYNTKGYCFDKDKNIFACIIEANKRDYIALTSLLNYNQINSIACTNFHPTIIFFTNKNDIITYSNINKSIHMYSLNGELLFIYNLTHELANINVTSLSDKKNVFSVGMEDGTVDILNLENLKKIKTFLLDEKIKMNEQLKIYRENISSKDIKNYGTSLNDVIYSTHDKKEFSFYSKISEGIIGNYKIRTTKEKNDKITKIGITVLKFSLCGNYISVVDENHNNVVRIYETEDYSCITILEQKKKITNLQWDNILNKPRLSICTNTAYVYVWFPDGCAIIDMPTGFLCNTALWNSCGSVLLVKNSDKIAVLYQEKQKK